MTVGLHTTNVAHPWLNSLRSSTQPTAYSTPHVKLHTGDPGSAGTSNNAAGDTTRKPITQAAASGGAIALNGTLPVWTNGGTSETISHVSVWDALTSGNFLYSVALSASQAWVSGNTFTLTALGVSIAPLAA